MNHTNTTNTLESEGTDTKVSHNNTNLKYVLMTVLFTLLFSSAHADELHLFTQGKLVIGTVYSDSGESYLIEGFIENNMLEAVEIKQTKYSIKANSDGTGGTLDANSDGTGGTSTNANSDGTGGTQANTSVGTEANSDGTGDPDSAEGIVENKTLTVIIACESTETSEGLVESSNDENYSVIFENIYLDGSLYSCN